MNTHATTASSSTNAGPHRRRLSSRRQAQPEGEGESSREASAESNDETTTSGQSEGETDSIPTTSSSYPHARSLEIDPVARGVGQIGLSNPTVGSSTPGAVPSRLSKVLAGAGSTGGAGAAGSAIEGEEMSEGGSISGRASTPFFASRSTSFYCAHARPVGTDDGDISSAPTPSASLGARLNAQQPHVARAPVHLPPSALQTSAIKQSSASSSSSSSAGENETEGEPVEDVEQSGDAIERKRDAEDEVLWAAAPKGFLSNLSAEEIQEHIRSAIAGQAGRAYKINPPPVGRPVRIYADGVYDLLHYGHMLQLRQCKLAFPSVHLLVGCCSSSLVREHKAQPVMHSEERYESLRHLRWVDEVVEDAPWTVDQDFIDKWQIDYVAHDEEPYVSAGSQDVYAYAKSIGAFLPTKRTNGVSTSELLQRIVEGYREGDYDGKLRKIGHPELCSRQGSEAGTGYGATSLKKE
ncbi:choline-phosphate cytidylyltransferase [Sporobolomyces koalae]|uniref:choline-phosphate cytidylyltransferase n=1 Tax=Sporobolomyces koalae TaxID=500713 RepID=UPI00318236E6